MKHSTTLLLCCVLFVSHFSRPAKAQELVPEGKLISLKMPGKSFQGPLPPLTKAGRDLAKELRTDVEKLATDIGERNIYKYRKLVETEKFVEKSLTNAGYRVERQTYKVRGRACSNLIVEILGTTRPNEIVVVGAHYDSAPEATGANDNGSGVAAILALARRFAGMECKRTLRFVAFTNEEPPWFQTEAMGSLVYARHCRERKENIVAMICLETMGYYSDKKKSQKYPAPLSLMYPSTGNFIGFVGDVKSGPLVKRVVGTFRRQAQFPSQGSALPGGMVGVGFSDHWAFWQVGYPALMVTDTAMFRYPFYHTKEDTPDKIDYERTARVVLGLEHVVLDLVTVEEEVAKAAPAAKIKFNFPSFKKQ